jgi:hypothetical protein
VHNGVRLEKPFLGIKYRIVGKEMLCRRGLAVEGRTVRTDTTYKLCSVPNRSLEPAAANPEPSASSQVHELVIRTVTLLEESG